MCRAGLKRFGIVQWCRVAFSSKERVPQDFLETSRSTCGVGLQALEDEVGGIIRSIDGGASWENLSQGQYFNDDTVDMHGVLASRWRPGTIYSIGRAGMFVSPDAGDHW